MFFKKVLIEKNPLRVEEFFDGVRQIIIKPRHKIYSLAMEYWGFIFAAISFAALLAKKLGLFGSVLILRCYTYFCVSNDTFWD